MFYGRNIPQSRRPEILTIIMSVFFGFGRVGMLGYAG